jgi:hypothetical protein
MKSQQRESRRIYEVCRHAVKAPHRYNLYY